MTDLMLTAVPTPVLVTETTSEKPYLTCGAKNRQGEPCQQPAGWGTVHPGGGRCKLHGGKAPLGVSSEVLQTVLGDRIEQYKNDPDLLSLTSGIAVMRAIRDHFLTDEAPDYDKAMTAIERERALVKTANELVYGKKFTVTIDQVTDILRQILVAIKEELHGYPELQQRLADRIRRIQSSAAGEVIDVTSSAE